VGNIKSWTIR